MKRLAALLFGIFSLIPLVFPTPSYAANCINTAGYTGISIDCPNRYADTTCRATPTTYYKLATVTYTFGTGINRTSCTRTEHVSDAASGCTVIYPTCRGSTCNAVAGDPWTVDCGTSGICLPPGYTSAQACAGTACVTSGGGCIQVHNCSHSNCVSNACTTQLEDATCTTYAACQTTNPLATTSYCAPVSPTTPTTTPAPAPPAVAPLPAGSCTFTDPDSINHKVAGSNDCVGISGSGTCPCNNTASFNYTDDGVTCNIYPNGVLRGAESYSFSSITCTAPVTPNCNSGADCGDCSASSNTCSVSNGTRSCTYTTYSGGGSCNEVTREVACTINNCSSGFQCESGSCIRVYLPWIQTTGGDVHSQIRINTPGGP